LIDAITNAARLVTQRLRHLPTLVIVGAHRAGATHLYAHLVSHPRCFESLHGENDYLAQPPKRSPWKYRSQFPLSLRVTRKRGHVLEAAPSYLSTPSALRELRQVVPKARLIVLLRDPVVRSFSHYQHNKTLGIETRSFANCVADELSRNEFPARSGVGAGPNAKPMTGYASGGYYGLQLELLLQLFPRNKVLLMDSATMFQNTVAACERVFNFLGLNSFEVPPTKFDFRDWHQQAMDPWLAAELREHYRPYDELLTDVVGQQFSWMTQQRAMAA
jgi:hypothetical protein